MGDEYDYTMPDDNGALAQAYGAGSGWGQDVMQGDMSLADLIAQAYGPESGWGQDVMPAGEGALSQLGANQEGSPNVGSPTQQDLGQTPEHQNAAMKMIGAKATADGTATDWSDPKTLSALLKAIGIGGNFLSQVMGGGKQQAAQSTNALQAQLAQNSRNTWNPVQAQAANNYFGSVIPAYDQRQRVFASQLPSPITPGRGYAQGGEVMMQSTEPHGALGLVAGSTPGQADAVPANLSHGEYVWDADVVSALGDGNNEAGAKALDEARERIRKQKRSAPPDKIPPPAKPLAHYLKKG